MRNEIVLPTIPYTNICMSPKVSSNDSEFLCPMHYHNEIELLHIISGKMDCMLQNRTVTGEDGDIIFINERVPHGTKGYSGLKNRLMQFRNDNFFAQYTLGGNYNMALFLSNAQTDCLVLKNGTEICEKLKELINLIVIENENRSQSFELIIKGYQSIMIGSLYRYGILKPYEYSTDAFRIVSDVVSYTDINFKKDISLDNLCKKFGINKSYFCRQFKRATNKTFVEYLNFVRILESQRLLVSTTDSITDIALECGFSAVSYFNRVFRHISGCSPKEFRKIKTGEQKRHIIIEE